MDILEMTKIAIAAIIGLIAIYDVFALVKGGTVATISYRIRDWSKRYVAFTFMVGFAMGHLFWPMAKTPETEELSAQLQQARVELQELELASKECHSYDGDRGK